MQRNTQYCQYNELQTHNSINSYYTYLFISDKSSCISSLSLHPHALHFSWYLKLGNFNCPLFYFTNFKYSESIIKIVYNIVEILIYKCATSLLQFPKSL